MQVGKMMPMLMILRNNNVFSPYYILHIVVMFNQVFERMCNVCDNF